MITYQEHYITKKEQKILNKLKKNIKEKDIKIFIGFEYGFFKGCNIFYGNLKSETKAKKLYDLFIKEKIRVRLFTNYFCEYDIVLILGYTNQISERLYLQYKMGKIIKALSSL